jgi:hypothetical protein
MATVLAALRAADFFFQQRSRRLRISTEDTDSARGTLNDQGCFLYTHALNPLLI